jgi:hypothetical protein
MSDYRNFDFRDGTDPLQRNAPHDPNARPMNAAWGWIAAAVFLVVVLAVAFGIGHQPGGLGTNTASNDTPPAVTHMAPPASPGPPAFAPAPTTSTPAPLAPTPNTPASPNSQ